MTVIGDVKDKNVILVDDMVDTAGTITKAPDLMISKRCSFCPRHRQPRRDVRPRNIARYRIENDRNDIYRQYSLL